MRPSLIKIDVEDAEMLVLAGARETILSHHRVIIFEFGGGAAGSPVGERRLPDLRPRRLRPILTGRFSANTGLAVPGAWLTSIY
jgi:hypothetical protein